MKTFEIETTFGKFQQEADNFKIIGDSFLAFLKNGDVCALYNLQHILVISDGSVNTCCGNGRCKCAH